MFLTHHKFLFAAIVLFSTSSIAKKGGQPLQIEEGRITASDRQTAMPELGEGRLAKILMQYYKVGLGGSEGWGNISSLKVCGTIKLGDLDFELTAYQKKPDLLKITTERQGRRLVRAYDGKTAWQITPGAGSTPQEMTHEQSRRFIHNSRLGNHLLYPCAKGKTIVYINTVPLEGHICHQIRVTLDSGYQVDYYIDIRSYLEIKVTNLDLETEFESSILFRDYTNEFGMPIAKRSEIYENGECVGLVTLQTIKVNSGVVPWMFKMRAE